MSGGRAAVGIIVSALYLIVMAVVMLYDWPRAKEMPLNNWGDFLAGVFAPLAFLWLVIGYLQQGDELRLNTEALRLQAEQLKQQVQETKLLVQEASAQAKASAQLAEHQAADLELQAQKALPRFEQLTVTRWPTDQDEAMRRSVCLNAVNVGSTITSLHIVAHDDQVEKAEPSPSAMLATSKLATFKFWFRAAPPSHSFEFDVHYHDGNGMPRISSILVAGDGCMLVRHGARPS